ncbi:MAG: hypothetical protein IKO62_05775 [Bacteroidales bacterium]|nr:hypothetical protein [Bacteroidales bacterium]
MKKFICFISMIAMMACAFSQNYYTNSSSSTDNTNKKDAKEKKDSDYKVDRYNELEARRVVVGITFGPSFNWMNWKNHKVAPAGYERSAHESVKLGLRYGVNLDIDLTKSKNFYVSTGVLIEHTGGSLNFNDNIYLVDKTLENTNIDRKYKSIYFTIPTAITLRTPSFNHFIIGGNIGFYHSFNLYSRYQSRFQIDPSARETDKETINYVTTDWAKDNETALFKESIFAGLGVEYVIKRHLRGKLYINYAQSLNNYFSKNAKNSRTGVQEKAAIGTVEILFGLYF